MCGVLLRNTHGHRSGSNFSSQKWAIYVCLSPFRVDNITTSLRCQFTKQTCTPPHVCEFVFFVFFVLFLCVICTQDFCRSAKQQAKCRLTIYILLESVVGRDGGREVWRQRTIKQYPNTLTRGAVVRHINKFDIQLLTTIFTHTPILFAHSLTQTLPSTHINQQERIRARSFMRKDAFHLENIATQFGWPSVRIETEEREMNGYIVY